MREDGSVVTWGDDVNGGDSSSVAAKLTSGVKKLYSTDTAFAALKTDGSVVSWGDLDWIPRKKYMQSMFGRSTRMLVLSQQ